MSAALIKRVIIRRHHDDDDLQTALIISHDWPVRWAPFKSLLLVWGDPKRITLVIKFKHAAVSLMLTACWALGRLQIWLQREFEMRRSIGLFNWITDTLTEKCLLPSWKQIDFLFEILHTEFVIGYRSAPKDFSSDKHAGTRVILHQCLKPERKINNQTHLQRIISRQLQALWNITLMVVTFHLGPIKQTHSFSQQYPFYPHFNSVLCLPDKHSNARCLKT